MDASFNYYRRVRTILLRILILNWSVALAKTIWGMMTQSASLTADGFHSFSDGASNIIGLIGVGYASQPVDADHPYGHKKYETFASIVIAMLLFLLCINVLRDIVIRLMHPVVPQVNAISFWIMGITMLVNLVVMIYEQRQGRILRSDILISDAYHTRSDLLVSSSVLVSLFYVASGYPLADVLCALAIVGFIAYTGFQILRHGSDVLCDRAVLSDAEVRTVAMKVEGVKDCHGVRTRGRHDDIHVDLHATVSETMSVDRAHAVADRIEELMKKEIRGVSDVVVHIEPPEAHK